MRFRLLITFSLIIISFPSKSQNIKELIIGKWICIKEGYNNDSNFKPLLDDSLQENKELDKNPPEFELIFGKNDEIKYNSLGDIYKSTYQLKNDNLTFDGQTWLIESITEEELVISNMDNKILGKRTLIFKKE